LRFDGGYRRNAEERINAYIGVAVVVYLPMSCFAFLENVFAVRDGACAGQ
jgi:hypothetical protein